MIPLRTATIVLMAAMVALGGCSSRRSGPQVGGATTRTPSNVVTEEQIQALPSIRSVEDVLIQLVPGITSVGGGIRIRGMQGAPLIVINGIPMQAGEIPVSPRDVSRIEVLRTGGEIAAYGFRGNGGVILISTR